MKWESALVYRLRTESSGPRLHRHSIRAFTSGTGGHSLQSTNLHLREVGHALGDLPGKGQQVPVADDVIAEFGALWVAGDVPPGRVERLGPPHAPQVILKRPVLAELHDHVKRTCAQGRSGCQLVCDRGQRQIK